jgi:regulator of chromosome condensation
MSKRKTEYENDQRKQRKQEPVGLVYSFGCGDFSQLGLGPEITEQALPSQIISLPNIISISSGAMHNAVIDLNGDVWTWGCNDDMALGHEDDEFVPTKVNLGVKIMKVSCGASHTIALSNSGQVYSWGQYRNMHGIIPNEFTSPRLVEQLYDVGDIACGDSISIAATNCGTLYQWGHTEFMGRTEDASELLPNVVSFSSRACQVFAGGYSVFIIDNENVLYGYGLNNYGQIGLTDQWITSPMSIEALSGVRIISVACALHHTLCVDEHGVCYSWGRGRFGRLGHGNELDLKVPTAITTLNNVSSVSCGESHSSCVTIEGRCFSFGSGDLFQLGSGIDVDSLIPVEIKTKNILAVSCGSQHTLLLAKS